MKKRRKTRKRRKKKKGTEGNGREQERNNELFETFNKSGTSLSKPVMYLNWDGEGKAEAFGPALDLTPHQAGRRPSASVKCIHALHAGCSTRRATLRLFCFTN